MEAPAHNADGKSQSPEERHAAMINDFFADLEDENTSNISGTQMNLPGSISKVDEQRQTKRIEKTSARRLSTGKEALTVGDKSEDRNQGEEEEVVDSVTRDTEGKPLVKSDGEDAIHPEGKKAIHKDEIKCNNLDVGLVSESNISSGDGSSLKKGECLQTEKIKGGGHKELLNENWVPMKRVQAEISGLAHAISSEIAQAQDLSLKSAVDYRNRLNRINDEIQELRQRYTKITAKRQEKENHFEEAKTSLRKARDIQSKYKSVITSSKSGFISLKARLKSLRERLRDPSYKFAPRGALAQAVAAVSGPGETEADSGWWRVPGSVIETIFMFLSVKDVTRCEGVCKTWTRMLGATKIHKMLFEFRLRNAKLVEKVALTRKGIRGPMEYDEHYVLNLGVGTADQYVVSCVKQSVPMSFLSPVGDEDGHSSAVGSDSKAEVPGQTKEQTTGDGGSRKKVKRTRPSITMKPVVTRDKRTRSVTIMFTSHSFSGLDAEMAFVTKAMANNRKLLALRNRVRYLEQETKGDRNEAGRWFKAVIEDTENKLSGVKEEISSLKQQLESDHATRRFLDETLAASEQSRINLKEANAAMLEKSREDLKAKEAELRLAEEAKVGQQKKLEELNKHLKILVATARSLKESVNKLTVQRDQLKTELKDLIS
eukprot:CAMPEP_0184500948 /NCGR_PEP_ID=MMETSP0113_2-20130426/46322_1 /TAXON_ID=91329 /ORGANISM="Norrisiella sphaerica, Strain BC52" /LENGTH=656 /DNA_ID=CAMNT_0026889541 /DNA_START=77 /DNA_END=2047 /DNA_ORIENTATION=-